MTGSRTLAGLAVVLAVAASGPPLAATGGVAVAGFDRVRLLPPAGALIRDYENAGYRLRRIGDEVIVTVAADSLDSRSRFAPLPSNRDDRVFRLARTLTLDSQTHYEATSRVLGWIARSIAYDLDRGEPQDAPSVLERRAGYCTGIARLTVALLTAVGIPAREVAGYVLDPDDSAGNGYHRWVEVLLPDRGWVFSDPLRSHHYVPATYVRLASEQLRSGEGLQGLLLERRSTLAAVDSHRHGGPGVTVRRNSGRQRAASLHVQVGGDRAEGFAQLTGHSLRRTRPLLDGETTFVGLDPGRYSLRLTLPAGTLERTLELDDRVRRSISLPAAVVGREQHYGVKE